jgi:hypothetical protein
MKGDKSMSPININNKWYIEVSSDEDGYVLMANSTKDEPISFNSLQNANDYISSIN